MSGVGHRDSAKCRQTDADKNTSQVRPTAVQALDIAHATEGFLCRRIDYEVVIQVPFRIACVHSDSQLAGRAVYLPSARSPDHSG